jgi:monovalent cation:H+ antiporter-2, CPA2 family
VTPELQLILNATIALAIALAGGLLANALRQSPILGYLLAGVLIGPFTPGYVGNRPQIASLAEVGVIFLMFGLGVAFSLKDLVRIKGVAIGGAIGQVVFTILCGASLGLALGWPLMQGIFFGGVIVASSSMVILKTLMSRDEVASNHGRLLLSMSIVQDLLAVLLIVLLPKLAGGDGVNVSELLLIALKALVFIALALTVGVRLVPRVLSYVAGLHSRELFLVTAAVLAFGTAMLSALLGLSAALGAFLAGLMLSETEYDHRVIAEVMPLRDLFSTLFFVSIGMLIDVRFILSNLPAVVGMALFVMAAKALSTGVSILPFRLGPKTTAFTSLGMIPIGELNYVLAHSGQATGALSDDLYNLILTSSLLTIVLTPGAFWISPRVGKGLSRLPLLRRLFASPSQLDGVEATLEEHAIVVGYGRVGKRITRGLRQAGLPVVVIEQDLHLTREVNDAGIPTVYGDASSATVMAAAHPERARLIVVALPDFGATRAAVHQARRLNADAVIVARAQRAENDVKLREAGATAVVVPELAGALMLLEETLLLLDLPHDHIFTGAERI